MLVWIMLAKEILASTKRLQIMHFHGIWYDKNVLTHGGPHASKNLSFHLLSISRIHDAAHHPISNSNKIGCAVSSTIYVYLRYDAMYRE